MQIYVKTYTSKKRHEVEAADHVPLEEFDHGQSETIEESHLPLPLTYL